MNRKYKYNSYTSTSCVLVAECLSRLAAERWAGRGGAANEGAARGGGRPAEAGTEQHSLTFVGRTERDRRERGRWHRLLIHRTKVMVNEA